MPEAGDVRNVSPAEEEGRRRRKMRATRPVPCSSRGLVNGGVGARIGTGAGEEQEEMVDDGEEELKRDPLQVLGPDILNKILESLDARSVAHSVLVSSGWRQVASCNSLWKPKCEELLKGKAHISRSSMVRGASMLQSYSCLMLDSRRHRIMKEDLCDHSWEFRFKKTAPSYWLNLDPSWKGTGPPMHRYFHADGSQTADPGDEVWGGHECSYCTVTSFLDDGAIRKHYVRINRWPPFSVTRRQDWSWELDNDICHYSSVPDAEKLGGTGPHFPFW